MDKFYAGVGSRSTPTHVLEIMTQLATKLALEGWVLRSGGATGADSAFEAGATLVNGKKEIYLARDANEDALNMASMIHPAWHKCSDFVRKLHARNCFQVLGRDLRTASSFVACWTLNGADVGGTRTAIVLARAYGIEVVNLGLAEQFNRVIQYLK